MTATATPGGVRAEHVVVPLLDPPGTGSRAVARLGFDNGLERVELRMGEGMADLVDARFGGTLPVVWASERNVHVEYPLVPRPLGRGRRHATVRLNAAVPWALDVHGGAAYLDAELAGADLRSVTFHSGSSHLRLVLGRPAEPCTIRLTSVSDLLLKRPPEVPVRLTLTEGAAKVALDDRRFAAVKGLSECTHPEPSDTPGYTVIAASGAADVTITR